LGRSTSNQFYHANKFIDYLTSNYSTPFQLDPINIVTGQTMDLSGAFDPEH